MTSRTHNLLERLEQLHNFTIVCYCWGIFTMVAITATMFFFVEHSSAVFSVYTVACASVVYLLNILTAYTYKEFASVAMEVDDLLNYQLYLASVENLPYLRPNICSCCKSVMHTQVEPMRGSEDQYFLLCDVCGSVNFTLKILQR